MPHSRRATAAVLTIAAGLAAVAGAACFVVSAVKNRNAVTTVAETFALPEFDALPTESLTRLGDAADWDAHDLRTFSFVSAILAAEELPSDAPAVRATVRSAVLAGDYAAALEAVRSVQALYDRLRRGDTLGVR